MCYSYVNLIDRAPDRRSTTRTPGRFHVCGGHGEERDNPTNGQLRRPGHHRPRGPRGGAQAARHVHRLDRCARPAPPRLRGRRQLRRRGARRLLHDAVDVTIHPDNSVTVDRRRPRHPGRDAWRRRTSRPSRSCSPSCTPAASSATAAATRSPAACTASASRSSTRCRRRCTSRSAATATSGRRTTRAAPRRTSSTKGERCHEGAHRHDDHVPARRRDLRDDSSSTSTRSSSACARRPS